MEGTVIWAGSGSITVGKVNVLVGETPSLSSCRLSSVDQHLEFVPGKLCFSCGFPYPWPESGELASALAAISSHIPFSANLLAQRTWLIILAFVLLLLFFGGGCFVFEFELEPEKHYGCFIGK